MRAEPGCVRHRETQGRTRPGWAIEELQARHHEGAEHRQHPAPPHGDFHGIVGRSPAMLRVFDEIKGAARSSAPVLIVGETGTGKELIARAVHNCGPRHAAPFVAINCAALPRELIESELFGYRRGAFSGALTDHLGLFRAANGGTVLLDEITEMSVELQAKLLRVVQDRHVRPVGSVTEVPVDVRFIASTNRDPNAVLGCGSLRSDLYYRLSVCMISVPPLRERRDDILLLLEHYLPVLRQRYGETEPEVQGVSTEGTEALLEWRWPGNVRELFNVLERAFTGCTSLHIGVEDLALPVPASDARTASATGSPLETFEASERALIERTLARTGGNKARAARLLAISRKKLYARIAKYALRAW